MIGTIARWARSAIGLERRADVVSYGAYWDSLLQGQTTDAGISVSHRTSLAVPAVLQAVTMISGDLAKLPLELWRRTEDANGEELSRQRERGHIARRLVRRDPGFGVTPMVFFQTLMAHALLWGRGAAYILRNYRGQPKSLSLLNPDQLTISRKNGLTYFEYATPTGQTEVLPQEDVFYIPGLTLDGVVAVDTISTIRDAIGVARAHLQFTGRSIKNNVSLGGILIIPPGIQGPAKDKMVEMVEKSLTPKFQGKVLTLPTGAELKTNAQTHRDAQLAELTDTYARDVARIFNLSPSRLGLSGSVSYNSKMQDDQAYLDSTLSPWMEKIRQEANLKLLTENESDELYFEHIRDAILAMSPLERAQEYAVLTRCRVMKPSEARQRENLPPAEGADKWLDEATVDMPPAAGGSDNTPADGGPVTKDSPMNAVR